MTYAISLSGACRILIAAVGGALLGGFLGLATAQDRPPGQLDTACASDCVARGLEAGFCSRACWVPDPEMAARAVPVNFDRIPLRREHGAAPVPAALHLLYRARRQREVSDLVRLRERSDRRPRDPSQ